MVHELLGDINFRGFTMRKGTLLIQNMYCIHFNKETWGDPENFRPDRFLNNPSLKEYVFAFQPGRRMCPGDLMAKEVLGLFMLKLFSRFSFFASSTVESSKEYLQPNNWYGVVPKDLPVSVEPRGKW